MAIHESLSSREGGIQGRLLDTRLRGNDDFRQVDCVPLRQRESLVTLGRDFVALLAVTAHAFRARPTTSDQRTPGAIPYG